ncbi:hypothetical protein DFH09DRAFT_1094369 [Mycena vulgaris]|nr:hypothetical protein DFH09DRAFT_1094369 [Mycena vulgaris]
MARQPKCHCSALSQQDQNSSDIADICELRMKRCSTRSMLHETRRARAQSSDVQRVERVKEGWGNVRASAGKWGTATHNLHLCGPSQREQRSRRERTGDAAVLEDRLCVIVLILLRLGLGRAFVRSACCGAALDARWSWVVAMEEELQAVESRSPRKEHGPQLMGVCEDRVLGSHILVKRDRRGEGRRTEGKNSGGWVDGRAAQAPSIRSQRWGESTVGFDVRGTAAIARAGCESEEGGKRSSSGKQIVTGDEMEDPDLQLNQYAQAKLNPRRERATESVTRTRVLGDEGATAA